MARTFLIIALLAAPFVVRIAHDAGWSSLYTNVEKVKKEAVRSNRLVRPGCLEQYQFDPNFAKLTWPVVGAERLSNYKVGDQFLEINLSPLSEIVAVAKGTIISITDLELSSNSTRKLVLSNHDNHLLSVYEGPIEVVVKVGQPVLAGDLIGYSSKKEIGALNFELRHCYSDLIFSLDLFQN